MKDKIQLNLLISFLLITLLMKCNLIKKKQENNQKKIWYIKQNFIKVPK